MKVVDCDFLVVGSGSAGVMSAIHLAPHGKVIVLTKKNSRESNTNYAQGGVACVVDDEDSFREHIRDTLDCGAGLCDPDVVDAIVRGGPARIAELEELGLAFWKRSDESGAYDLGQEGGHSKRRVLHAGDRTGKAIEKTLLQRAKEVSDIDVREHSMVIELITTSSLGLEGRNRCVGAYVLDRPSGEIYAVRAPVVVLATGGGGKVYLYTSNPDIATGDGVAIAWRAGVPIKNMEFIQFHPTCLFHPEAKSFLVSEAVRGEGGRLLNLKGEAFMSEYDERAELAPRDVVARAIDHQMKVSGDSHVLLDIRHKDAEFVKARFPGIYQSCLSFGIDITRDPIPVVPAAHYFCGGIEAGVDGRTALEGLFAVGEVACTGLHGANRLASNSLLEALVCAHHAAGTIAADTSLEPVSHIAISAWEVGQAVPSDERVVIEHNWKELRTCMWDYVGIVRSDKRLERALRRIQNLRAEIREYYLDHLVTDEILELRNILDISEIVVKSAMARTESRGLHYTLDHPTPLKGVAAESTVIRRKSC